MCLLGLSCAHCQINVYISWNVCRRRISDFVFISSFCTAVARATCIFSCSCSHVAHWNFRILFIEINFPTTFLYRTHFSRSLFYLSISICGVLHSTTKSAKVYLNYIHHKVNASSILRHLYLSHTETEAKSHIREISTKLNLSRWMQNDIIIRKLME